MDKDTIYKGILKQLESYKSALPGYTESAFANTVEEGAWSPGEVYHHVLDSSILSIGQMRRILKGSGEAGEASLAGQSILVSGEFPANLRLKAPQVLAERVVKINKATAEEMIATLEHELRAIHSVMSDADQALTTQHPRLGFFNIMQWFRFIEVHLKHHIKQLERLKQMAAEA